MGEIEDLKKVIRDRMEPDKHLINWSRIVEVVSHLFTPSNNWEQQRIITILIFEKQTFKQQFFSHH